MVSDAFVEKCGLCGCTDIGGGATAVDYCKRCGAIDNGTQWYLDKYSHERIHDKYKSQSTIKGDY